MITDFAGDVKTERIPQCPTCKGAMVRWRRFCSTGELPPDPNGSVKVYRFEGELWSCSQYGCRHGEREYDSGRPEWMGIPPASAFER